VVAIRDGKLATETVRATRAVAVQEPADGAVTQIGEPVAEVTHEEVLEELTVLDSAGRLQIPKDYLQRVNIKSRVTLEVTEEGILIRPAGDMGHAPSAEALGAALAASKRVGKGRSLQSRLLDRVLHAVNPTRKNEG
jgi:bifunctional DNA-binding transcriptional regulator/antitoxin component of YhaV-PrlF toxin-antitoxin module